MASDEFFGVREHRRAKPFRRDLTLKRSASAVFDMPVDVMLQLMEQDLLQCYLDALVRGYEFEVLNDPPGGLATFQVLVPETDASETRIVGSIEGLDRDGRVVRSSVEYFQHVDGREELVTSATTIVEWLPTGLAAWTTYETAKEYATGLVVRIRPTGDGRCMVRLDFEGTASVFIGLRSRAVAALQQLAQQSIEERFAGWHAIANHLCGRDAQQPLSSQAAASTYGRLEEAIRVLGLGSASSAVAGDAAPRRKT